MIAPAPRSTRFVHINRQTERKMIWWFKFWAPKLHSIIFTTYTPMPLLRFRFSFRCLCLFSWNLAFGAFFHLLKWSFAYILLVVIFIYIFLYFYLPLPQLLCIVLKPHQKPLRLMLLDWDGTSSRIVNARHTDWKTLLLYYFTLIWLIFFFVSFFCFVLWVFKHRNEDNMENLLLFNVPPHTLCMCVYCVCVFFIHGNCTESLSETWATLQDPEQSKRANRFTIADSLHVRYVWCECACSVVRPPHLFSSRHRRRFLPMIAHARTPNSFRPLQCLIDISTQTAHSHELLTVFL